MPECERAKIQAANRLLRAESELRLMSRRYMRHQTPKNASELEKARRSVAWEKEHVQDVEAACCCQPGNPL